MATEVDPFLTQWHRAVTAKDLDALHGLLAEDVSLGPPPYWGRLEGRDLVHHLLGLIIETIDAFTYHREWQHGPELALEFTGHVGEVELQGIDLISLDDQSKVRRLDVLIRPAQAVDALGAIVAPKMQSYLADRSKGAA